MKTPSPRLQSRPTWAPAITCANAQMRVPAPTSRLSTSAAGWNRWPSFISGTVTEARAAVMNRVGDEASGDQRRPEQEGPPGPNPQRRDGGPRAIAGQGPADAEDGGAQE